MADVYQNSYLTLAATVSLGDSQGCFQERSMMSQEGDEVRLQLSLPSTHDIAIRQSLKHWTMLSAQQSKKLFPALSRAWVFQERILSPRVLHMCGTELVWKCREAANCECESLAEGISPGGEYHQSLKMTANEATAAFLETTNPVDGPLMASLNQFDQYVTEGIRINEARTQTGHHGLSMEERKANYQLSELKERSAKRVNSLRILHRQYEEISEQLKLEKESSELSRRYRKLVERYSALELTKSTDRLPALSGICKRLAPLRGEFVAGLWVDSMGYDLLWRIEELHPGLNCDRPILFLRPSWSWISVPGSVKYWDDIKNFSLGEPLFEIPTEGSFQLGYSHNLAFKARSLQRKMLYFQHHVRPSGHNEFGELSEAILRIISYSRQAELVYATEILSTVSTHVNDSLKYKLAIGGHQIPLFADYAFGFTGSHHVPDGAMVTLLLIHPSVALVIKPSKLKVKVPFTEEQQLDGSHSEEVLEVWERIGIARISGTVLDLYGLDWMGDAEIPEFNLV